MRLLMRRETLAIIVMGYSLLAIFLGWLVGVDFVVRWFADLPAIVPSTCFSFLLIGMALYLLPGRDIGQSILLFLGLSWASLLPAGSLFFMEFMPQWTMNDILGFSVEAPDRMSVATALALLGVMGLVTALLGAKTKALHVVGIVSAGCIVITVAVLAYYLFAAWFVGKMDPLAGMSLPTVSMFLLVFHALWFHSRAVLDTSA